MASHDSLPELVRDFHLPAVIRKDITIHTRPLSRRTTTRNERWRRKKILGNGGYGVVWLEMKEGSGDTQPDTRAVKCIRIADQVSESKLYVRELDALAKFSQEKYAEFFVKSHGWYESPGWLHIAMEYCQYGDLKRYLADSEKGMPEDQCKEVTSQILSGLISMHEAGFAHRDLKPANILIKSKPPEPWWIKLGDVGLSKRYESVHADTSTTIRGTPAFMAPETLGYPFTGDSKSADLFAADMWSFGGTVFSMLTVQWHAFKDARELLKYQAQTAIFPSGLLISIGASEGVIDFIQSLMAPLPEMRLSARHAWKHPWLRTEDDPQPLTRLVEVMGSMSLENPELETQKIVPIVDTGSDLTPPSGRWSDTLPTQQQKQPKATTPTNPVPQEVNTTVKRIKALSLQQAVAQSKSQHVQAITTQRKGPHKKVKPDPKYTTAGRIHAWKRARQLARTTSASHGTPWQDLDFDKLEDTFALLYHAYRRDRRPDPRFRPLLDEAAHLGGKMDRHHSARSLVEQLETKITTQKCYWKSVDEVYHHAKAMHWDEADDLSVDSAKAHDDYAKVKTRLYWARKKRDVVGPWLDSWQARTQAVLETRPAAQPRTQRRLDSTPGVTEKDNFEDDIEDEDRTPRRGAYPSASFWMKTWKLSEDFFVEGPTMDMPQPALDKINQILDEHRRERFDR